jgi:3-deoxy-D-manno-octulosonic-acid transferase
MILSLYRAVTALGAPLIDVYLKNRLSRGKEDSARFGERFGIPGGQRPKGPLVWIHAASIGEALSVTVLAEEIVRKRKVSVLLTTGTVSSARIMSERLPAGAIHQFVPVDRLPFVKAFLDHWRPDLALWVESEFWPNLIVESAERGIPLVLVNGRVSEKSFKGWLRFPGFSRRVLSGFKLALGQTERDAQRLGQLGIGNVDCCGNLKFASDPLPVDPVALADLQESIAGRPCWLAASTHPGEEEIAAQAHRLLASSLDNPLTILVPRHRERGGEIVARLRATGWSVAQRSAGEQIQSNTDIYVADTLGELGLFFRLAPVVFMGKSLVGGGGQNPIEPARLGCAVLFGPLMSNFTELSGRMIAAGAAREVAAEQDLPKVLLELLRDPTAGRAVGARAKAFAESEADVLERLMRQLAPFLDQAVARHAGS